MKANGARRHFHGLSNRKAEIQRKAIFYWDFSRLLGTVILSYYSETAKLALLPVETSSRNLTRQAGRVQATFRRAGEEANGYYEY